MKKLLILTLLFTVSCIAKSGNEKITDGAVTKQLRKGMTKGQVIKLLGESNDISVNEKGEETWTYNFKKRFRDPSLPLTFVLPYGGLVPGPNRLEIHYLHVDFKKEKLSSYRKSRTGKLELPRFLQRSEKQGGSGKRKQRERRRGR